MCFRIRPYIYIQMPFLLLSYQEPVCRCRSALIITLSSNHGWGLWYRDQWWEVRCRVPREPRNKPRHKRRILRQSVSYSGTVNKERRQRGGENRAGLENQKESTTTTRNPGAPRCALRARRSSAPGRWWRAARSTGHSKIRKIIAEWTVSLWPDRTSNGEDVSSVSASRIPCTSFLSRFFRSPETSILEVMSSYLKSNVRDYCKYCKAKRCGLLRS